ncbi:winged helix-turn-helix transcriptional regulator [Candidatus Woesearchaeota archaeon]|nr:winged helix-turn-helix transcriptional regulator [Candidatus Woesearchaeota archaeon]
MADEPFLLVSLEEDKAKTLAQVLSNDTARKILDLLSKKENATETEIAKELKIPLSTAHYNLGLLVKSDLVSDAHFNYSEKGKKVVHYSLSNKYVVIAPKKTDKLKETLKKFLPVVLISAAMTIGIRFFSRTPIWIGAENDAAYSVMQAVADEATSRAAEETLKIAPPAASPLIQSQEFAVWFLFGTIFALVVYFVWAEIILKKKK